MGAEISRGPKTCPHDKYGRTQHFFEESNPASGFLVPMFSVHFVPQMDIWQLEQKNLGIWGRGGSKAGENIDIESAIFEIADLYFSVPVETTKSFDQINL